MIDLNSVMNSFRLDGVFVHFPEAAGNDSLTVLSVHDETSYISQSKKSFQISNKS